MHVDVRFGDPDRPDMKAHVLLRRRSSCCVSADETLLKSKMRVALALLALVAGALAADPTVYFKDQFDGKLGAFIRLPLPV